MEIITGITELRELRARWRQQGEAVALVPTMGNLHSGHMSLIRAAQEKAERIVVSIFVNPLQFGEGEDFKNYPRTFKQDIDRLSEFDVDAVFTPNANELYGDGFKSIVQVKGLSEILCGEYRPGHFAGVATVVMKLFNIVQPEFAVFGQKDFQQLLIIQRMVRDLDIPVQIVPVETLREEDGLAMSSRNSYLSDDERKVAPALYAVLDNLRQQVQRGERNWRDMERAAVMVLEETGFRSQYISIRMAEDLTAPERTDVRGEIVILGAVFLGNTRLIDNVTLSLPV